METSTRFGAEDAKTPFHKEPVNSWAWGLRNRPPRWEGGPSPRWPRGDSPAAAERDPSTRGHLLPGRRRDPAEAGRRRMTPPATHARARWAASPAPLQAPATPLLPCRPPSGQLEPSPPPPPPSQPPPPRGPVAKLPVPSSRLGGAPCPGNAAGGRLPRARAAEGLLSKRTHIIHAKLIPAASRPPARGCAPSLAKPRSLHPPPPPPPGGGVPGSAGDGTSRESCKMSTPSAKRSGHSQGNAGPPRPLHFYRRNKRVRSGRGVPASPAPRAPARPGPLPGRCLTPDPRRPCRVCPPVTWFPLQPSRRSGPRGSGSGGPAQANPAPPGAQRGNGLWAARPAAAAAAPGSRAGPLRPRPGRRPAASATARSLPLLRAARTRHPAGRLRTCLAAAGEHPKE
ncbi:uncharacterized protein [Manis javanica]|uniref:uncharacterized protein n=1 Tax=Manis javanica TaxID=9974 RepID=UPI003C6D860C